jgi:hypothetical protein
MLRSVLDVEVAVLADVPHGLYVVGTDAGLTAHEPRVPLQEDDVVTDRNAGEQATATV